MWLPLPTRLHSSVAGGFFCVRMALALGELEEYNYSLCVELCVAHAATTPLGMG